MYLECFRIFELTVILIMWAFTYTHGYVRGVVVNTRSPENEIRYSLGNASAASVCCAHIELTALKLMKIAIIFGQL